MVAVQPHPVLLGLAVYLGLRWQLQSLASYYIAVAVTLAIWASSLAFVNSYTIILPMLLGALGSLLLALAGLRAAWRGHVARDGSAAFWLAGTGAVLLPSCSPFGSSMW